MSRLKGQEIRIPKSPRSTIVVEIEGTALQVQHRFPEKARQQIRDKQQNLAKLPPGKRDPEAEFKESMYQFKKNGEYGFPAGALAESIVNASVDVMPLKKSMIRRNMYVESDGVDYREKRGLIRIEHDAPPEQREDVVRLAGAARPADLRYRGAFDAGWKAKATVRFDERMLSIEQVVQLLQIAGESIGLCEGRPEKTLAMGWGTFKVNKVNYTPGEKTKEPKEPKEEPKAKGGRGRKAA